MKFAPRDPVARDELHRLHAEYMEPNETLETVSRHNGIGHNTLRKAFAAFGLPVKVNRHVSPDEVRELQRELDAPIDYLAAKYNVHENTARLWLKNSRYKHKKFQGAPAKKWWNAMAATCEGPNEFFRLMTRPPHDLNPQRVVDIYHRRFKPENPLLWRLDHPTPAMEIAMDDVADYAESTEPDPAPRPTMYLGMGGKTHALRWANRDDEPRELAELTEEKESDVDLQSIADDLGIPLEDM
jgi:hypothetical protein